MIYQFLKDGRPAGTVSLYPGQPPLISNGLLGIISRLPSSQAILPFADPAGFRLLLTGLLNHPIIIPGQGVITVMRY